MRVALELQTCCGRRSGIGNYAYELARHLKPTNDICFQGNVFNFRGKNNNSSHLKGITMDIRENKVIHYGVYQRIWKKIPIPYHWMFPTADITHFFNYIVPPHVKGKVVNMVHDMTYLRYPETMRAGNLKRIQEGIESSIERSSKILTLSEFSKKEIIELLKLPESFVDVVYCAPTLSSYTADWFKTMKKYKIMKPYILYVGTIEPRKNLIRLLKAFHSLKVEAGIPHQLVLAGGKGWNCDDIYLTAKKLNSNKDIIFCGYVSDEEKNALYKHAEAFVFPSLYEGFGIPPLEAMSLGVPTITAKVASLPEVVGDGAVLVNPMNEQDIANGIYSLLSNKEYANIIREKGKERAKLFSYDKSAQKLLKIYQEMI